MHILCTAGWKHSFHRFSSIPLQGRKLKRIYKMRDLILAWDYLLCGEEEVNAILKCLLLPHKKQAWNKIKEQKNFHSEWYLDLLVPKQKSYTRSFKRSQTPGGKRHSGINVCSAKGNTLNNEVVSEIELRRKHKVFTGWFQGIQSNELLCEVVNEPYEGPGRWRKWSKTKKKKKCT